MTEEGLGIDFGDVIVGARVPTDSRGVEIESDYLSVNRFLRVLPIEGAFEAIRTLHEERFGDRIWIISKWREVVRDKCRVWLNHHRFFEITGVSRVRLMFCEERAKKVEIARSLGLTHFVDNKLEVVAPMIGIVPHLFLFRPSEREIVEYGAGVEIGRVRRVESWPEIVRAILNR